MRGAGMYTVFCFTPCFLLSVIQPVCPSLYFHLTSLVSISRCLYARLSWMDYADVLLAGFAASRHKLAEALFVWAFAGLCTSTLRAL